MIRGILQDDYRNIPLPGSRSEFGDGMAPSYGDFWSGMGEVMAWGKEGAGVGGCCGGIAAGNLPRRGFSYGSVDRLELYK